MRRVVEIVGKPFLCLSFLFVLLVACEKDTLVNPVPDDGEEGIAVDTEKKGIAFTLSGLEWSHKVAGVKPFWHYSWGSELSEIEPDNVEFVPMFWGKTVSDEKIAQLKQFADEGKIKYLLGFNEPDGEEQANMTVDEAIALWPKLEEVGVPLGSPATVNPLNDWMKEFMTKAETNGLRVDFICVHNYGGINASALRDKLNETYAEYNKPIWITEFAVGDWNATSPENNRYSTTEVLAFMRDMLPILDNMEIVERYAWFSANTSNAALTSSALYNPDGSLTQLGMYYRNHTANNDCGAGADALIYPNVEGNLIPNGNFGDYHIYGSPDEKAPQSVAWFGYQFEVEAVDVVEGWAARMKNGWSGNSGLNNTFPVEAGKTYQISFYAKWLGSVGSINMSLKDRDAIIAWEGAGKPADLKPATLASSPTIVADTDDNNEWTQVYFEYTIPDGIANLQLTLWKPDGSSLCLIDEVVAKEYL